MNTRFGIVRSLVSSAVVVAILGVPAGCDLVSQATSRPGGSGVAGPAGSPVVGLDWARAGTVERPVNFEATLPPSDKRTHPILRVPGQAIMADVAARPGKGFVAVGYIPPGWVAAAWTAPDGLGTWSLHSIDATPFSFAVAVAVGADGTIVAVGRSGSDPVAWTSTDGASWQRHAVPTLGRGVAERMTSVVATGHGFLAGGSVGPELFDRRARFWTSADGASWQPVPDDAAAFANSEVRSIVPFQGGFVAVGTVGSAQKTTAAIAWTSRDGTTWTRVDDPAFANGVAVSVTPVPFGGLVAVGSDAGRREALAWISQDGRRWTKAPSEPSRQYPGFIWMTDAVAIGDTLLAVGVFQGLQRGTATSWVSHDGLRWEQARTAPVQEQGEFYSVVPSGPGAIVVGSFGGPDSYVPTVWFTPGR